MLSRVSPFRDLRIKGYVLLPEAFRSLSRLSSALSAKASALRPYLLDLFPRRCLMQRSLSSVPIALGTLGKQQKFYSLSTCFLGDSCLTLVTTLLFVESLFMDLYLK